MRMGTLAGALGVGRGSATDVSLAPIEIRFVVSLFSIHK
jgi:hypothetical protein